MNRLSWFGIVCVLLAAVTLVGATSGFTAANADRGMSVDVVGDDRASIGVATRATPKYGCGVEVTVVNRLPTTVETVTVDGGHHRPRADFPHETAAIEALGPGEAATVTVSLDKTAARHEVAIEADDDAVSVDLTREVDASDVPPCRNADGGRENGHGNDRDDGRDHDRGRGHEKGHDQKSGHDSKHGHGHDNDRGHGHEDGDKHERKNGDGR